MPGNRGKQLKRLAQTKTNQQTHKTPQQVVVLQGIMCGTTGGFCWLPGNLTATTPRKNRKIHLDFWSFNNYYPKRQLVRGADGGGFWYLTVSPCFQSSYSANWLLPVASHLLCTGMSAVSVLPSNSRQERELTHSLKCWTISLRKLLKVSE